jgi:hypothetical protein
LRRKPYDSGLDEDQRVSVTAKHQDRGVQEEVKLVRGLERTIEVDEQEFHLSPHETSISKNGKAWNGIVESGQRDTVEFRKRWYRPQIQIFVNADEKMRC